MTTLHLAATGPTPAEEVWERYAQPALWSAWSPQVRRVEIVGDRLSTGAAGRVVSLLGLSADFEVDTWDEDGWRWSWTVRPRAALLPGVPMPRLRLGLLARRRGDNRTAGPELERALGLLRQEREDRIVLFGGGFGRIALTTLCRAELDACGARR